MRKKLYFMLCVLCSAFVMMTLAMSDVVAKEIRPAFSVTVVAHFSDENSGLVESVEGVAYASRLSFDDQLPTNLDYAFAFWIVNGIVMKNIPIDFMFTITQETQIQAIFSATDDHAVVFMDSNGRLLDIQYVKHNESADNYTGLDRFHETFANFIGNEEEFVDYEEFDGVGDVRWAAVRVRADLDRKDIDKGGIMLKSPGGDNPGSALTAQLQGGLTELTLDIRRASETIGGLAVDIFIDQKLLGIHLLGGTDIETLNIGEVSVEGDFELEIRVRNTDGDSSQNVVINNLIWLNNDSKIPSKPNTYIDEKDKWSGSYTNIQDDTILYLKHQPADDGDFISITVVNGTCGGGDYLPGDVVTVTCKEDPVMHFSHWEVDGNIVSFDEVYELSVFSAETIVCILTPGGMPGIEPKVWLRHETLRPNAESYIGQFYIPPSFTLIDYGIITSDHFGEFELFDEDVTRYAGYKYFERTNEFLMSFLFEQIGVRAYLVAEGVDDTLFFAYSDVYPGLYHRALAVDEMWDDEPSTDPVVYTTYDLKGTVVATTDVGYILQNPENPERMISVHDLEYSFKVGDKIFLRGDFNVDSEIARIVHVETAFLVSSENAVNLSVQGAVEPEYDRPQIHTHMGRLYKMPSPWAVLLEDNKDAILRFGHERIQLGTPLYRNAANTEHRYFDVPSSASAPNLSLPFSDIFVGGDNDTHYSPYDLYFFIYDVTPESFKIVILGDDHIVIDEEKTFTLDMFSDTKGAVLSYLPDEKQLDFYEYITIEASIVEGVTFLYWLDENTGGVISTERIHTFNIQANMNLTAVYSGAWDYEQTFDESLLPLAGEWDEGTYIGDNGIDFDYVYASAPGNWDIHGGGIQLCCYTNASSLSFTVENGLNDLFFLYQQSTNPGSPTRYYEVLITNEGKTDVYKVDTFGDIYGFEHTVYAFMLNNLEYEGVVTVEIRPDPFITGHQPAVFNDIRWNEYDDAQGDRDEK